MITLDTTIATMADQARICQRQLAQCNTTEKNALLLALADALEVHADDIAQANTRDIMNARQHGMDQGKLDRLLFDKPRIVAASRGVRAIVALPDPVGQIVQGHTIANGLRLTQVRVPLGVLGLIYEARPNVTVDVAALCIKSGNAALLRGGSAAVNTNKATVRVIAQVLNEHGVGSKLISSIDEYGRSGAQAMMHAHGHVDVLVPRGSSQLIQSVVEEATVPVIETGAGNVHIYIDKSADVSKVMPIVLNAKTQRVGVCNAAEKLLVHRDIAQQILPQVAQALSDHQVLLHADEASYAMLEGTIDASLLVHAEESDWSTEYLSLQMGIKIVDSMDTAIAHIARYSTGHTETIIAEDYNAIERFTALVDSAVVFVNASTRFTDGGQFGFGAELGISTQKLHARGPMGLREMTTTKWIGYGNGQIRA